MADTQQTDSITPRQRAEKMSRAQKDELLRTARKQYASDSKFWQENFDAAKDDLKFNNGDHWSAQDLQDRADRPTITVQRTPVLVSQVTNEIRQNRPSISVSPDSDSTGAKAADIYKGWIRAVEADSDAETAFDTGSFNQVANGFGYWRLLAEYDAPDSFDQTLVIARVKNVFTVLIDPAAQQPDSSDKKRAFVSAMMDREDYKHAYPNAEQMPWEVYAKIPDFAGDWCDEKFIRVAEYWRIETKTRTLLKLDNGHIGYKDELDEPMRKQVDAGTMNAKARETEVPQVMMYKISGADVLEVHEWPGKYIPIVRIVGQESDIEGKTYYSGIVRPAKDPCKMYDYSCSAEAEKVMLEPKAPYMMAVGQDEGLEQEWNDANVKNLTRLHYNPIDVNGVALPPPRREPFQGAPAGLIAAKQSAIEDIHACTGIHIPNIKQQRMPDESGVALAELRQNTDLGTYHYIDNYARALMFTGEMLLDLAPHYMSTERMLTILRDDGKNEVVRVDPSSPVAYLEKVEGDKNVKIFNPKKGKYKVTVTIGPNYATKRKEAATGQLEFMKIVPGAASIMADIYARNQDWDGAEEVSRRFQASMPPHLVQPPPGDVPPQVQGFIMSMRQQMMVMAQQNQQLQQALSEKQTQFALTADKNEKDHEAKMAKIAADVMKAEHDRWDRRFDQIVQLVQQQQNSESRMSMQ